RKLSFAFDDLCLQQSRDSKTAALNRSATSPTDDSINNNFGENRRKLSFAFDDLCFQQSRDSKTATLNLFKHLSNR
ncbi:MAG: hypothetical protein IKC10_08710, partial [Alphaproteobacteria bacterium]|nr:hypothetical protein [Alphaproteobacteria bacterium]